ncbi:hypothetical protein IAU60_003046 [Kwoniella sp. DSM 27419]
MPFTPVHTLLGGYLLHLATSSMLEDTGRVFGISGIVDGAIFQKEGRQWRWAVLYGLVAGPFYALGMRLDVARPSDSVTSLIELGFARLALAGALVGLGSRLGSGCTSGHMLCGVSRLSPRSLVATAVFFTTAVITANLSPSPATSTNADPAYALQLPTWGVTAGLLVTIAVLTALQSVTRGYLIRHQAELGPVARSAPYVLYGLTFSLGLSVSGMTDPDKVLGFLRFPEPGKFDPSLAMVILGGVVPNAMHYYRLAGRRKAPARPQETRDEHKADEVKRINPSTRFPWESWRVPSRSDLDWRLILGSVLFGLGWGLAGICPGPALVNLGQGAVSMLSGRSAGAPSQASLSNIAIFLSSMLGGMGMTHLV